MYDFRFRTAGGKDKAAVHSVVFAVLVEPPTGSGDFELR